MKKPYIFLLLIPFLLTISCDENNPITGPGLGEKLIDTTINVSVSNAIIQIEGVEITIPKGLHSESFDVIIREVEKYPNSPETLEILKAYDIEMSFADQFEDEITIRYDIESEIFNNKAVNDFALSF